MSNSRENSIRATDLFQSHYCIITNHETKCVMEQWIRKINKFFAILCWGIDYIGIIY